MLRRSRLGRAPTVALAVYLACVALVFSFILFEVLDIDGSDFPVAPVRTVAPPHPAEAGHDIKRTHFAGLGQLWIDLQLPGTDGVKLALPLRATTPAAVVERSPVALAFRVGLARSSLDLPPSA